MLPFFETQTCSISIKPDMQFHFFKKPVMPNSHQTRHVNLLFLKPRHIQFPSNHAISLSLENQSVQFPSNLTCFFAFLEPGHVKFPAKLTSNFACFEIRKSCVVLAFCSQLAFFCFDRLSYITNVGPSFSP